MPETRTDIKTNKRINTPWIGVGKLWKCFIVLLFLVIGFIAQLNHSPDQTGNVIKVITIREIYNNGNRNISDLRMEGPTNDNNTDSKHGVGFSDLEGSDCQGAFAGKATNKNFKQNISRWNITKIIEIAEQNCESFRNKYGLNRYPTPLQEELDFPLSFSIVFHTDFDQVLFLLRAVYRPHNLYCLHSDKKSPQELQDATKAVAKCLPNVYPASVQENVVYAGYSRLKADLNCMNDAVQSPVQWRYHMNMVGQQFPLKSNLEMVRILKLFNGTNDIEGITGGGRLVGRYQKEFEAYYNPESGLYNTRGTGATNPPPPYNIVVVKGSVFGTFSRAFVEYVTSDPVAASVLKWSETVYSPDEYVWATLQHSAALRVPGGNNTGNPNRHGWFNTYANWGEKRCYGKYIHGICIFTAQDLPLLQSRHSFFANKFQIEFHPAALHCLDRLLYRLTVTNTVTDLDFYKKLKFGPVRLKQN